MIQPNVHAIAADATWFAVEPTLSSILLHSCLLPELERELLEFAMWRATFFGDGFLGQSSARTHWPSQMLMPWGRRMVLGTRSCGMCWNNTSCLSCRLLRAPSLGGSLSCLMLSSHYISQPMRLCLISSFSKQFRTQST